MGNIGKYIYGIIPNAVAQGSISSGSRRDSEAEIRFGINSNQEKFFGPCGINACETVYTISYEDISAVVSDSEVVDYTHMRKDALARLLLRHQKIIEKVMLKYTIIPMRLGTFVTDNAEVKDVLSKGYDLVNEIFKKIDDKIEIDVACTWSDFAAVLKEAGEESEIKEFKERLLNNPKGVTVDDQMKVGSMLKKALDERRDKFAKEIQDNLKTFCVDFKTHELMDDNMIVNTAFLINKARQKEFYAKIEHLNNEFAEKLNFRCVGPLPPYSFYTLEIKKWQLEEIGWARRKLGLQSNIVTKDEIKKAHRALAFSSHPDKNPDTPGIEKEFDEVTHAYKILWEYCRGENCSFDEQDFKKNAILVKVRE